MTKRDYIDFQDRSQPLAYLITFRCYGTWLHGAERGSIDRRNYNRYGTPDMPANPKILADEAAALKASVSLLDRAQRNVVESSNSRSLRISRILASGIERSHESCALSSKRDLQA